MEPKHPQYPERRYRPFCIDPVNGKYVVVDTLKKIKTVSEVRNYWQTKEIADDMNEAV